MIQTIHKIKNQINTLRWNVKGALINRNKPASHPYMILIYHGLVADHHVKFNSRFLKVADFKQQMKLLKNKFHVTSINNIFQNKIDHENLNIGITFDDGYKNNFKYAADILDELQIPASFFITTVQAAGFRYLWTDYLDITSQYAKGNLEIAGKTFQKHGKEFQYDGSTLKQWCKKSGWGFKLHMMEALKKYESSLELPGNRDYCELMSESEMKSLSENTLFTIGSHGYYHNNLALLPIKDAGDECRNSKVYLEKITNKDIIEFAYPDGNYNNELAEMVEKLGYTIQLIVSRDPGITETDKVLLERFTINPYLNPENQVKYIVKGNYF